MPVQVDERRHHGLSAKVDAYDARTCSNASARPCTSDAVLLNENGSVTDDRPAAIRDEIGALEENGGGPLRLRAGRGDR
jgi:hypothetical protein